MAAYTGESRHLERAAAVFRAAASLLQQAPAAVGHLAGVLAATLAPPRELAVVGAPADPATAALLAVAEEAFRPEVFLARGDGLGSAGIPLLEGRFPVDGRPAAYLCRNFACEAPITDPAELRYRLADGPRLDDGGRRVAP
jgi:hypothetical protein